MALNSTSSSFADAEPFPPLPVAAGAPPPAGAVALDFFITFESSGKWPDNLAAVGHLRTAFYLRLASLLEEQHSFLCEVREEALYVRSEGFTFRGIIHHEPAAKLLEAAGDVAGARALAWRTTAGAQHMASVSALGRTHPALGPSIRLAKRWLACQLYSGELPAPLVELLVAAPFASADERPPASAMCGFAHFLHLLSSHDFQNEPLLLSFDAPITTEMREVADAAFAAAREGHADADAADAAASPATPPMPPPPIWVGTDNEIGGAAGCAGGPSPHSLHRLRNLASAALVHLDRAVVMEPSDLASAAAGLASADDAAAAAAAPKDAAAAAAAAVDRASRAVVSRAFDPPAADFDVLLELSVAKLPSAHLSWLVDKAGGGSAGGRAPKPASAYANLRHGEIASGIGDEPIAALVARLTLAYGSIARFFYDGLGGRAIALKWKPAAFLPTALKAPAAQHRMLVATGCGDKDGAAAEAWALPNVADALAGMVQLGDGLIKSARVPQASHALRKAL